MSAIDTAVTHDVTFGTAASYGTYASPLTITGNGSVIAPGTARAPQSTVPRPRPGRW